MWDAISCVYHIFIQSCVLCYDVIDLANPKANANKTAGFTKEEREGFTNLLGAGFVDSFRHLYPDTKGAYSWWSYMGNARSKNVGWYDYLCPFYFHWKGCSLLSFLPVGRICDFLCCLCLLHGLG